MTLETTFVSVLGPEIVRYLSLKRALGRRYAVEQDVFRHLDAFLFAADCDLTPEKFANWCHTRAHLTPTVRRNWMRIVRNFCLYRHRTEPSCFLPDPSQFPHPHQPMRPHIFTEEEITHLLRTVDQLEPTPGSPLRREVFRLAVVLLYTTGLRRGELVRLRVGDYDPYERTVLVRESKFHKSRILALSTGGSGELDAYLQKRRTRALPVSTETPLVWNRYGGGGAYTGAGFGQGMRDLFQAAGIRTRTGQLPRVHDFRHAFAVHALLRWYRSGANVQAKLPYLAAYMGHVSIVSTQYYLHFIDELAATASDRFEQHYGTLVTTLRTLGGAP